VRSCAAAISAALAEGYKLQRVELDLPLIGATDLDDWPGGVRQQLQAVTPLLMQLLTEIGARASVPVDRVAIDDADGVVLFQTSTHRVATFPTADTLGEVKQRVQGDARPCVLVNAAWSTGDFGWGPFVNNELLRFAESAAETFSLRRVRIRGQDLRVLRSYPAPYVVYAVGLDGQRDSIEMIGTTPERPAFAELEGFIAKLGMRSIANADVATRLRAELVFNKETLDKY
jgi:hypothetical protein